MHFTLCQSIVPEPKLNPVNEQYWVSAVLFISFILFVFVRIYYRKPFEHLFNSFLSRRSLSPEARDEFGSAGRSSLFLSILFVLNFALFIYQATCYYKGTLPAADGMLLFGKALLFIAAAYFVKIITIGAAGFLFREPATASEYIYTVFQFIKALGVLLLPITIALAYIPVLPPAIFVHAGIGLVVVAFVLRTFKVLQAGAQNKAISSFYLFLYLCTLEILPLVVLIKVFMNSGGHFS